MPEATCKQRIESEWKTTKKLIQNMLRTGSYREDVLGADHVTNYPNTYDRIQFSYGGPQDELRRYPSGKISYWFLDWFDGAEKKLSNSDYELAKRLYDEFDDLGSFSKGEF